VLHEAAVVMGALAAQVLANRLQLVVFILEARRVGQLEGSAAVVSKVVWGAVLSSHWVCALVFPLGGHVLIMLDGCQQEVFVEHLHLLLLTGLEVPGEVGVLLSGHRDLRLDESVLLSTLLDCGAVAGAHGLALDCQGCLDLVSRLKGLAVIGFDPLDGHLVHLGFAELIGDELLDLHLLPLLHRLLVQRVVGG